MWYGLLSRGVSYWEQGQDRRILFGTADSWLYALDAATGLPIPTFGDSGRVDLASAGFDRPVRRSWISTLSPPVICRDAVVVGSSLPDWAGMFGEDGKRRAPPGDVRAFDVRTGQLLWTFHTIPREGEFGWQTWEQGSGKIAGGANVWTMMSADEELGFVYLPVSTPSNDYYGGERPGDGLFGESLVCLKARTGERVWHFQVVHHGLWDLDLPAAPILADITVDGNRVKAVVQVTKQGFAFVFDRVTGEPVWPIDERPVPPSTTPGEHASPTQPFPAKPAAFERQGLTDDNVIDFTKKIRSEALRFLEQFDRGPLYTPPTEKGLLALPSHQGGADWAGAALNPRTGVLFVPSHTAPIVYRLSQPNSADSPYRLVGGSRGPIRLDDDLPLTKPPYGRVTAIDLNTGEHLWMRPVGTGPVDHPRLRDLDLPPLGWERRTFALSTPDLLLLASHGLGSLDDDREYGYYVDDEAVLRALDPETGELLAEVELPANAEGGVMSYMVDGRQYIVIAGGGNDKPAELTALALPMGEPDPDRADMTPRYQRTDADHARYYRAVAAIDRGDKATLQALLRANPDLAEARGYLDDSGPMEGATLLHHIAGEPQRTRLPDNIGELAHVLLAAGSDPDAETASGWSTIGLLTTSHQAELFDLEEPLMQVLADAGASFNTGNGRLLWQALAQWRAPDLELAARLVAHGAETDLRFAAALGDVDGMRSYFDTDGALRVSAGRLFRPSGRDTKKTAELLTDQQVLDEAFSYAVYTGQLAAAAWLLERGADIDSRPAYVLDFPSGPDLGFTALHKAVIARNLDSIRFLIERSVDPTIEDARWGSSPRRWASYDDATEIMELLSKYEEEWQDDGES